MDSTEGGRLRARNGAASGRRTLLLIAGAVALLILGVSPAVADQSTEALPPPPPQADPGTDGSVDGYQDATPAQAAQLFQTEFPEMANSVANNPLDLSGQHPQFLNDHTAIVSSDPIPDVDGQIAAILDRDRGDPEATRADLNDLSRQSGDADGVQLVSSVLPLRTADGLAARAPVDLSLMSHADSYSPQNPLVDLTLPDQLSQDAALPDQGLRLDLADDSHAADPIGDQALFYANAAPATDAVLAPTPNGLEALYQLRGSESPSHLELGVSMPDGAHLEATSDGGAQVLANGGAIATIRAPVASDASGQPVQTSMAVNGDALEIEVSHSGGDIRYPVLVDPTVIADTYSWSENAFAGWTQFKTAGSPYQLKTTCTDGVNCNGGLAPRGLYALAPINQPLADRAEADWRYTVPHYPSTTAYISSVALSSMRFSARSDSASQNPFLFTSVFAPSTQSYLDTHTQTTWGNDLSWSLNAGTATTGKLATFGLWTWQARTPTDWRDAFLGNATIQIGDTDNPQITSVTHAGITVGANGESNWVDNATPSVTMTATDGGLGIKDLWTPDSAGVSHWADVTPSCTGAATSPCPQSVTKTMTYDTSQMTSGGHMITLMARDPVQQHSSFGIFDVRVDHAPPQIVTTGGLSEDASGDPGVLHVAATDGDASTSTGWQSGVKSIDITMNGDPVENTGDQTCTATAGSCPLSIDYTLDPSLVSAEQLHFQVVATDELGHQTTQAWTVANPASPGPQEDIGPGAVSLTSGNFQVMRQDAWVDGPTTALAAIRTYNSQDATTGAPRPFGPGWLLSVPVPEATAYYVSLDEVSEPDGGQAAKIMLADGSSLVFRQDGGGYTSPLGFERLTLTKPASNRYELTSDNNDVTVFEQPSGTGSYIPTTVRTGGRPGASTFTWDVANGAPRLKEELAPAPAGVNCGQAIMAGCRALRYVYGTATTATGTTSAGWGDFNGQLSEIDYVAFDPATGGIRTAPVARFSYDNAGYLRAAWDPRITPALKETYDYDGSGHLVGVTPPGEEKWTMAYTTIPADPNGLRLATVSRPALPGTATTTVSYRVPTSGSQAPYQMSPSAVGAWGQTDAPVTATAIFAADTTPGTSASSLRSASVYYINASGRETNLAAPGGRISTVEHDRWGNVVSELSPTNRERALASGGATTGNQLASTYNYSANGSKLLETLGPQHEVQVDSGQVIEARAHSEFTYDEGAPSSATSGLPTSEEFSAAPAGGGAAVDVTRDTLGYDGQQGLGWQLRTPTSVTQDSGQGGLSLEYRALYDGATGTPTQLRTPSSPSQPSPTTRQTILYTADASAPIAACRNRPEWAGLPCQDGPAAQPATGAPLPTTMYEYDYFDHPVKTTDTGGTQTRVTTRTYVGDRVTGVTTSSSLGAPTPDLQLDYDPASGELTTMRTTLGSSVQEVHRGFDSLGRMTSYTDAAGNTTTYSYDILDREVSIADGRGTQTMHYDPVTGDLLEVDDSGVGTFTGTYDSDGLLSTETLPNGLKLLITRDEEGLTTHREYVRTGCIANCSALSFSMVPTIRDDAAKETSPQGSMAYSYDGADRLTEVKDTTGPTCVDRTYTYDADGNRIGEQALTSAAGGQCGTGTSTAITYPRDAAGRLSSVDYDAFGRATHVPSGLAGGQALDSTYESDDLALSHTQGTDTVNYTRDPAGRLASVTLNQSGTAPLTATEHYADETDVPAWADEGQGAWSRYVIDLEGDLGAIQKSNGTIEFELSDLEGDVVATATPLSQDVARGSTRFDEYGVPSEPTSRRYGWLGADGQPTTLPSGVVETDDRTYVPSIGEFLQLDSEPMAGDALYGADVGGDALDAEQRGVVPIIECELHVEKAYAIFTGGGWRAAGESWEKCDSYDDNTSLLLRSCIEERVRSGSSHVWLRPDCDTKTPTGDQVAYTKSTSYVGCGGRRRHYYRTYGYLKLKDPDAVNPPPSKSKYSRRRKPCKRS